MEVLGLRSVLKASSVEVCSTKKKGNKELLDMFSGPPIQRGLAARHAPSTLLK